MSALHAWIKDGQAPATGDPLVLTDAGNALARDAHGNALGGIRTAAVDAPIATLSGEPSSAAATNFVCALVGQTIPFTAAQLSTLYPTHADYVNQVVSATTRAEQAGFITAADVPQRAPRSPRSRGCPMHRRGAFFGGAPRDRSPRPPRARQLVSRPTRAP